MTEAAEQALAQADSCATEMHIQDERNAWALHVQVECARAICAELAALGEIMQRVADLSGTAIDLQVGNY